ncbi:MAG TPA: DUF362 domain-containing protein [bacterium]|nr:DUF362 domain-containing protein [bacterium]HPN42912.1 DUF362 domain-containing protein [bacterium]
MGKKRVQGNVTEQFSRRDFISTVGAGTAALLLNPVKNAGKLSASTLLPTEYKAKVAATRADNYDRAFIKSKVQHLFEALGGISDVVHANDKVAIKINLTGGSGYASNSKLVGGSLVDNVWTHPEVLRAVGELILDCGVKPEDLYIVEAIWDAKSYNNYGYKDVQTSLGCQLVDLNKPAPFADFMEKSTGDKHCYYESFTLNRILDEVNVFVSIPKMKHHFNAAVTHSMKNLIGITPLQNYIKQGMSGYRSKLHEDGGDIRMHLPRSICDLNLARPVNLAVIDGIKNADGGEGPWNSTFQLAEYHLLLAGKDPVATDSIASVQMGNDPEADKLYTPVNEYADNYLKMLAERGMGTNIISEIELVGDGASTIKTSVRPVNRPNRPETIRLLQNYPNPFNPSTTFNYTLKESGNVSLTIYDTMGRLVDTVVDGYVPAGEYFITWTASNLPSGVYFYKLQIGGFSTTRKLVLQK